MVRQIFGRLESGETEMSVTESVGVPRNAILMPRNWFQETGNVRRPLGKVAHVLSQQLMASIWCYKLVETENIMLLSRKGSFFWQQDGGWKVKLYKIGFTKVASMHLGHLCIFLGVYSWLLSIEIGRNVIGVKYFSLTISDSV